MPSLYRAAVSLTVAALAVAMPATFATGNGVAAARPASMSLCPPATPSTHPRAAKRLRVGVDPGTAGNPLPSTEQPAPVDRGKELKALEALRPHHRVLVVRLNRLFWSGGEPLLRSFAKQEHRYSRHGFDVEVQVRYHPTKAEDGDIARWARWVRHVTRVLGADHRLVGLTVTNEVNFAISPNTSDGSYTGAKDALIRGIEAAHQVLVNNGWARRVRIGFTFAYRLNPETDSGLFSYLRTHGGARFRRALGFVGLDD